MPEWLIVVLGVLGGLLLLWIALAVALWVQQARSGRTMDWRAILRLGPDVVRLLKRLAGDPSISRSTRWWLLGLLGYLLLPIDLIPDFIPVIGFADDAIVVAIALRFAIRHAGADAVARHWPGTPAGLESLLALTGARPRPDH
ncbi:YkvA family protein [Microbacterium sp. CFBP9034]|uniref:YkvA family protein n=1 Tax=Microbacterium sp. CFBP9034 TaxID=3096540 RepID=UPI002A69CF68|nr:YkvA family protein [Microbacterium sp. CFBP9034]MDY0909396.1 YkvA family protein [Microbacterium sp. CFBP9034]